MTMSSHDYVTDIEAHALAMIAAWLGPERFKKALVGIGSAIGRSLTPTIRGAKPTWSTS